MSNKKTVAAGASTLEAVAPGEHGARRPTICWNRSKASTTGMMTAETAELLGLPITQGSAFRGVSSLLPAWMTLAYWKNYNRTLLEEANNNTHQSKMAPIRNLQAAPTPAPFPSKQVVVNKKHEYLALHFSPLVLAAMKAHGMSVCLESSAAAAMEASAGTAFVSTNDMVTAATWLLKRQLSREASWNLSVVVNLRGRCGVNAFGDDGGGLFGNAISNVVARFAPSSVYGKTNIRLAAQSIRRALVDGIANEIPDRIATSRLGRAMGAPSSLQTFSTTSWRALAPWKIRFSDFHTVMLFAGQPVCPLPKDGSSVYSSVLHSSWDGGCTVELFLPSSQVEEAVNLHKKLCRSYIDWHVNNK